MASIDLAASLPQSSSHPNVRSSAAMCQPIDRASQMMKSVQDIKKSSHPIKVLIVDDQPLVRQGLQMRLELEQDIRIVGEAEDGNLVLNLVREVEPDVVIMDVEMPMMDGITATNLLHAAYPQVAVVILTIHDKPVLRERAFAAGASSFVEKRDGVTVLLKEIRQICAGSGD